MAGKCPWEEKWITERELSGGGQGLTFCVISNSDANIRGVAKQLKNKNKQQARVRMNNEVSNLVLLGNNGVKVPKVFDGNTSQWQEDGTPLYFVMERIEGDTLESLISKRGKLGIELAAGIALDLLTTISNAHRLQVTHRDVKPANIIVRNVDPADVVIVDFGLSFNAAEAPEVTQTGEPFRNDFFVLPEYSFGGSDHRDFRSDLTAVCGIFYYVLTGHVPCQLRDEREHPPHKRQGKTLKDALGEDARRRPLDLFFDLGFSSHIEDRFQNGDELRKRLTAAINPLMGGLDEPSVQVATRVLEKLQRESRKTQLLTYRKRIEPIYESVLRFFRTSLTAIRQDAFDSRFEHAEAQGFPGGQKSVPHGYDLLGNGLTLTVSLFPHSLSRSIAFAICSKGKQCVWMQRAILPQSQSETIRIGESDGERWKELIWFDANELPSEAEFNASVEAFLARTFQELGEAAAQEGG